MPLPSKPTSIHRFSTFARVTSSARLADDTPSPTTSRCQPVASCRPGRQFGPCPGIFDARIAVSRLEFPPDPFPSSRRVEAMHAAPLHLLPERYPSPQKREYGL